MTADERLLAVMWTSIGLSATIAAAVTLAGSTAALLAAFAPVALFVVLILDDAARGAATIGQAARSSANDALHFSTKR